MDLVTQADIYSPSIDDLGNYIDVIPSFNNLKDGLKCSCGSKDKRYSYATFRTHIKTQTHQKWLCNLNLNKANYYVENENLKNNLQNQRLIIAKFEKELNNKIMTIDYLTQQLTNKNNSNKISNDLLLLD